jgi:hypothetical protein
LPDPASGCCLRKTRLIWQLRGNAAGPDAINNAIDYAKRRSPSNLALIRVYDQGGNGSSFTHVVLCAATAPPPKVHMGKVSPTFIDITLCACVWQ